MSTVIAANGNFSTTVFVGNSTVNATTNSTSLIIGSSTVNSTVVSVGSNVVLSTSSILIGNSTVNVAANSTAFAINGDNISPVQSFRNKIINGNFDFWQRGTSTSAVGYLADRWQTGSSGSTFTTSRQAFTLGQTAVPNEPTYFHRTVVTSVAGASNYCVMGQYIESVRTLAGQTATLSFWAKADASKNMAVEFFQSFGTSGSPSSEVYSLGVTTCALTTSWKKFTVTVNLPSISGKTLGSDNNNCLGTLFWFDGGSYWNYRNNSLGQQSGTFDIAQVQLEAGSVATPFEMRPMQTELALCQRYYEKSLSVNTLVGTNIGNNGDGSIGMYFVATGATNVGHMTYYKVTKRAIPSITVYSSTTSTPGSVSSHGGGDIAATVSNIGTSQFFLYCAGTNIYFYWTASAEI